MSNYDPIEALRAQVYGLLLHDADETEATVAKHAAALAEADAESSKAARLEAFAFPPLAGGTPFSEFIPEHIDAALQLANSYDALVREEAEDEQSPQWPGLAAVEKAVVRHGQGLSEQVDRGLLDYALMLFATHNPVGRRYLHGTTPPLLARQLRDLVNATDSDTATSFDFYGRALPDRENQLAWFRSDPLQNDHHFHWHVVYPTGGECGRSNAERRQGELFLYMHTQMLARYDAERLAVGLPPVEVYHDYSSVVPMAYDPGSFVRAFGYASRVPETQPRDVLLRNGREVHLAKMQRANEAWGTAVDRGVLEEEGTSKPIEPNLLGNTIESTACRFGLRDGRYYNYHNNGHIMLAAAHQPYQPAKLGVMSNTATAIRDPIFWMWHKHIDRQSEQWQDTQPENEFPTSSPITVRPPMIMRSEMLDGLDLEAPEVLAAFDALWGDPSIEHVSHVSTRMRPASVKYRGREIRYEHLEHDRFSYFMQLHNAGQSTHKATLRVFIAPEDRADERRSWIEMDKLVVEVPPGNHLKIRRDVDASVIRKPAVVDPGKYNRDYEPANTMPRAPGREDDMDTLTQVFKQNRRAHDYLVRAGKDHEKLRELHLKAFVAVATREPERARPALQAYYDGLIGPSQERAYCECGWPYHLLLPRGNEQGMRFVLMVMATDWKDDAVEGDEPCCGSMSFCGAADRYPDKREMGYPFNRRFRGGLLQTLKRLSYVGMSSLVITLRK